MQAVRAARQPRRHGEQFFGVVVGGRTGDEHAIVAGGLLLSPQPPQAPPRERVEPVDAPGQLRHELRQGVPAAHVRQFVLQHDPQPLGRPRSRLRRQEHDRPQPAPGHRNDRLPGDKPPQATPNPGRGCKFGDHRCGPSVGGVGAAGELSDAGVRHGQSQAPENRAHEPHRRQTVREQHGARSACGRGGRG